MGRSESIRRKPNPELEKRYREQGSCCFYCGIKIPYELVTRDHVLPKSKGGTFPNNSVFACKKCNGTKGSLSLEEFKQLIIGRTIAILRTVVNNDFKITQSQTDKFKHNHRILMSIVELINKNKVSL